MPIPDDMWQNINRALDAGQERFPQPKRPDHRGAQWRPAVILAVAAGFFWFALIPALPSAVPDSSYPAAVETAGPKPWKDPGIPDPYNEPTRAPRITRMTPVADVTPRTASTTESTSSVVTASVRPQ